MDKDIARVVRAFQKGHSAAVEIGSRSSDVIVRRLRGVSDRRSRTQIRRNALKSIADAVNQSGYRTSVGEIGRDIKLYHTSVLLEIPDAPYRVLRLLSPLTKRIAKTEDWTLRSPDRSKELVANLPDLTPDQIALAVDTILGRKPRQPKPKPSPRDRAVKLVASLPMDDQRVIYQALAKKFGVQQTAPPPRAVPIPDPPQEKRGGIFRRAG